MIIWDNFEKLGKRLTCRERLQPLKKNDLMLFTLQIDKKTSPHKTYNQ